MVWALSALWDLECPSCAAMAECRSVCLRSRERSALSLHGSLPGHCFSFRNRVGFWPVWLPDARAAIRIAVNEPLRMVECPMVDYQDFAAKALRGETLTRSECHAVLDSPDEQLLGLL